MHTDDQFLFVVRTIENTDSPLLWKPACRSPEKVVFQRISTRLIEAVDVAALRIYP